MAIRYYKLEITYDELMHTGNYHAPDGVDLESVVGFKRVPIAMMCDMCKSLVTYDEVFSFCGIFHNVDWRAGYGSQHDGKRFNMDICDECMNKFGRLTR